jgi:hypothetical protein
MATKQPDGRAPDGGLCRVEPASRLCCRLLLALGPMTTTGWSGDGW